MISSTKIIGEAFLWFQDIHFGLTSIPIDAIGNSFFKMYEIGKRKGIKKVVIGGDLTERELTLSSEHGVSFVADMSYFLKDAEKNDIEIVVLEGTPSHDWKQARLLEELVKRLELDVKLTYINILSIVEIDGLGNVLFVPDQWRSSTKTTFKEIKTLMAEKGLTQVDWAFVHGSFKYQMPKFLRDRLDLHDEEKFSKIVKQLILVGHDHHRSNYKNIYCAGSLERWSHGQEQEKGVFFVQVLPNGAPYIEFIVNRDAQIFKDILVDDCSPDEILLKINKFNFPDDQPVHIRLTTTTDIKLVNEFIEKYKLIFDNIIWTSKDLSKKKENKVYSVDEIDLTFNKMSLGLDTIHTLLSERVVDKHPEDFKFINGILNDIVDEFKLEKIEETNVE